MGGGGVIAGGIALMIAGLIVPGIGAQQTLVEAGGYQLTETTYPYAPLGQILLVFGIILIPVGFIAMAASSGSTRRQEREQRLERQELYDVASRPVFATYAPPLPQSPAMPQVPAGEPLAASTLHSFCPTCGQHLDSSFCPEDGTKTKPLGGRAS